MKICIDCNYIAPAKDSMGSERVVEALARALVHLKHEVVMRLHPASKNTPAPLVSEIPSDCDIVHFNGWNPGFTYPLPWVVTIHGGGTELDPQWLASVSNNPRIICISEFIRKRLNGVNVIHNCIDPDEFTFKEKKSNYFLWLAGTDWGESKGLFSSIMLAKKLGLNLKIAGTGQNTETIEQVKSFCDSKIEYCGAVNGKEKAELLANAKAILNIGPIPDAFCLVNAEALVSGTPVIARNVGAHSEILNSDVAFLCDTERDIIKAISKIGSIDKKKCRDFAISRYGHIKIAEKHVQLYQSMIRYSEENNG